MNISGQGIWFSLCKCSWDWSINWTYYKFFYSRSGDNHITCTYILYNYKSYYSPYLQLNVNMMSTLLDVTVLSLECVLSSGPTIETVEIFSSSLLVSNLLSTTIVHLVSIASLQLKVLYLFAHLWSVLLSIHPLIHPLIPYAGFL